MKNYLLILILFFLSFPVWGQLDSTWNVLLLEKGNTFEDKSDKASLSKTGFYLYKNCVYEIELKNKSRIGGRLLAIKPDTLYFTNFFNSNAAKSSKKNLALAT